MYFLLQKSVIDKVEADIKTKRGKLSRTSQIKYLYVIHRLNHYRCFRKDTYEDGVPFNSTVLADKFSGNSIVWKVLGYLQRHNFIVKVRNAKTGVTSACYKLHESVAQEWVYQIQYDSSDSALIRKLEERSSDARIIHPQLYILRDKISLNALGIAYLESKYGNLPKNNERFAVDHRDIGLIDIHYKRFYAYRPDPKSRVYTNLTSLPRDHRKYISFDGKPMLMTDICNAQILFTVPLLHKHWAKKSGKGLTNLPQDVKDFQQLAETGMFYEKIAIAAGQALTDENERTSFKKNVFSEIWFSKNSTRNTPIKVAFKKEFPTVYDIIWQLKEDDYRKFAVSLQRLEASIMVDKVWTDMGKQKKISITLHDALICNSLEDLELAERIIGIEMQKHKLLPKYKRQY